MNRIDQCSYCKVKPVTVDLQDPDTSMAKFGQKIVGPQLLYDQQLGYGYHELKKGSTVRLKQFKKIVLMDKVFKSHPLILELL